MRPEERAKSTSYLSASAAKFTMEAERCFYHTPPAPEEIHSQGTLPCEAHIAHLIYKELYSHNSIRNCKGNIITSILPTNKIDALSLMIISKSALKICFKTET